LQLDGEVEGHVQFADERFAQLVGKCIHFGRMSSPTNLADATSGVRLSDRLASPFGSRASWRDDPERGTRQKGYGPPGHVSPVGSLTGKTRMATEMTGQGAVPQIHGGDPDAPATVNLWHDTTTQTR
jgi:hypothetical protein